MLYFPPPSASGNITSRGFPGTSGQTFWYISLKAMKYLYNITIHVCVPHFYDLSTLAGCWSSVYTRRIIYKFLNVCPYDYTAFAASVKVGYP